MKSKDKNQVIADLKDKVAHLSSSFMNAIEKITELRTLLSDEKKKNKALIKEVKMLRELT